MVELQAVQSLLVLFDLERLHVFAHIQEAHVSGVHGVPDHVITISVVNLVITMSCDYDDVITIS